jgi:hypothetical protein
LWFVKCFFTFFLYPQDQSKESKEARPQSD